MDSRYNPSHPRHRELLLECCASGSCSPQAESCKGVGQKVDEIYNAGRNARCPECNQYIQVRGGIVLPHPAPKKCELSVGEGFDRHLCGRAVPQGESVCKVHLEHRRRRAVRNAEWDAQREIQRQREAETQAKVVIVKRLLGIEDGVKAGREHNTVVLTAEAITQLLQKLG